MSVTRYSSLVAHHFLSTDGRTRTGTPFRTADFHPTSAFAAHDFIVFRGLDDAFTMRKLLYV